MTTPRLGWWQALWRGVGRVLEIAPPARPVDPRPGSVRDAEALAGDWRVVGDDLRRAIDEAGRPQ